MIDVSCFVVMATLRAIWVRGHGVEPPKEESVIASGIARAMFRQYASSLRGVLGTTNFKPEMLIAPKDGPAGYVTYPVRCLRAAETIALLGLLLLEEEKLEAEEIANQLCSFLSANPGAAHPISDRYAVSLIPIVLLLYRFDRTVELNVYVRAVIKWVADRYDNDSLGLAPPYASPQ